MAAIRILKRFTFSDDASRHSYVLEPEMGVVSHFPTRVVEAAVKAGAAEIVKSPSGASAEQKES